MRNFYLKYFVLCSVILTLSLTFTGKLHAQVGGPNGYTFSQAINGGAWDTNFSSIPVVWQSGTALRNDSVSYPVAITLPGGGFTYNCRKYNTLRISSNGFIFFESPVQAALNQYAVGLSPSGSFTNTTTNAINQGVALYNSGAIQPFGANLSHSKAPGANPKIRYGNVGANNFVISFEDMSRAGAAPLDTLDIINFQIWLSASGSIRFIYGNCTPSATSTSTTSPVVGLRGGIASDWLTRSVTNTAPNNVWTNSVDGTGATISALYAGAGAAAPNTSIFPPFDLQYTFTPPLCNSPVYQSLPAIEDFDATWTGSPASNNNLPSASWNNWPGRGQCSWRRYDENNAALSTTSTSNWTAPPTGAYAPVSFSGSGSARFHTALTFSKYYGDLEWYIDPSSCGAGQSLKLNYYYINSSGADTLQVFFSNDGGATFQRVDTSNASFSPVQTAWAARNIVIPSTLVNNSSTCVVRFRALGDGSASDIGLDRVSISGNGTAPTVTLSASDTLLCQPGQGLSTSTLTAGGATNYVWFPAGSYTGSGSTVTANPTSTTVFTVVGSDANCNTSSKTVNVLVGPFTTLGNTSTPSPLNLCPNGNATITAIDTSYGPSAPPVGYCAAPHSAASNCITNVTLGTLNNTTTPNCALPSYNIYSSSIPKAIIGANNTISVTSNAVSNIAAWIDYNRNGLLETTEFTQITTATVANVPTVFTLAIPGTALPGVTLMRIRSNSGAQTNAGACTVSTSGETEDYYINLIKASSNPQTYVWAPATYLNTTSGATVNASTVLVPGITYTVTGTSAQGCTATKAIAINVSSISAPVVTSNPTGICLGQTATLTATPVGGGSPYTFKWFNSTNVLISQVANASSSTIAVTPTSQSTASFTCRAISACGDSASTLFVVSFNPTPSISVTPYTGTGFTICNTSASSDTLVATGASTYTWALPANFTYLPAASTVKDTAIISISATTTYTVTGTNAFGCTATATGVVNFLPNYTLNASATPNALCSGGATTLKISDSILGPSVFIGPYCYGTHGSLGTCVSKVQLNQLNSLTSASCTSNYFADTLTVKTLLKKGTTYSCTIDVSPFGYAGVWIDYNRDGQFAASEFTSVVSNAPSGTVPILIPTTAVEGYTKMRVRSRSNTAVAAADFCTAFADGETEDYLVRIFSNVSTASLTGVTWSTAAPGVSISSPNAFTTNASPITAATTTFIATTTDNNGCTKQTPLQVTTGGLTCGTVAINGTNPVCLGSTRVLSVAPTQGGTPYSYSWTENGSPIGSNQNFLSVVAPLGISTYVCTVTDACGATCSTSLTVTVNTVPVVTIGASGGNVLCFTGSKTLTANVVNGTPAFTYAWTGFGLSSTSGSPVVATPTATLTPYSVVVTDANGCTATSAINITKSLNYTITASADPTSLGTCPGTVTLISLDTSMGQGPQVEPTGPYCASAATNTADEEIYSISLNGSSTPALYAGCSGCATVSANCGTGGNNAAPGPGSILSRYSNFTTLAPLTTLVAGSTYTFNVEENECDGATFYPFGTGIWVDVNRNGVFEEPAEKLFVENATATGPRNVTGSITIPVTAQAGYTRMRIIAAEGFSGATLTPCLSYGFGETEDWLVNIIAPAPNQLPSTSFTWTSTPPATYNPSNIGDTVVASTATATVFTVTASDANGCTKVSTVSVAQGPLVCQPINVQLPVVCKNQPDTLTANATAGGTPYTYAWYNSSNVLIGTTKRLAAPTNVVGNNTFTVVITDACGASCSKTASFFVNNLPQLSIATSIPQSGAICITGTDTLTASSTTIPTITNISWSPTTNLTAMPNPPTNAPVKVVISAPGLNQSTTYTCSLTDQTTLCVAKDSVKVNYSPYFAVSAQANPVNIGSCGGSVTLTAMDTVISGGPQVVPNGYCTPLVSIPGLTGDYISNFQFAGVINNTTGDGDYAVYPTPVPTVIVGQTYTVSMQAGPTWSQGFRVWIDLNRDGILSPSESVLASPTSGYTAAPFTGSITIPNTAQGGMTVMRAMARFAAVPTASGSDSSCFVNGFGEVEDYYINVIGMSTNVLPATAFTWSSLATVTPSVGDTVVGSNISAAANSFTVTATNAFGCTAVASTAVQVGALVCDSIKATKPTICAGKLDTIKVYHHLGGAPYTYTLYDTTTPSNPPIVQLSNNTFVVQPLVSTGYKVVTNDLCNDSCAQYIYINVNQLPVITASASAATICSSGNDTLSAVVTGATPFNYAWTGGTPSGGSTPTASSTVVGVTANTTYSLLVTDANTCTSTATVFVQFSPAYSFNPVATPVNICPGGSSTISISDTVAGPQTPPAGYCPSQATTTADEEIYSVTLNGSSTNSLYAGCNGCPAASANCSVAGGLAAPGPGSLISQYSNFTTLPPLTTVVAGGTYAFNIEENECDGGTFYAFGSAIWIDVNRNGIFEEPAEKLFVENTTATGPRNVVGTITIPTTALPGVTRMRVIAAEGFAGASLTPCLSYGFGETEDYLVNILATPLVPVVNYVWTDTSASSTIVPNTQGDTAIATANVTTTYTVTGTNAYGCTATATAGVIVGPLASSNINATALSLCENLKDTLSITVTGGGTPYSIVWSPAPTTVIDSSKVVYNVTGAPSQTYTVTVSDICGNTVTKTVTVNINPAPVLSISSSNPSGAICSLPKTDTLTVNCATCGTLVWSTSNALQPNVNSAVVWITPTSAGLTYPYAVTGTDALGCKSTATWVIKTASSHSLTASSSSTLVCNGATTTLSVLDTALATGPQTAPSTYCAASNVGGTGSCMTNVTVGTWTSTTPANVAPYYQNYTTTVAPATLVAGASYPVTVTVDPAGTYAGAVLSMWVDFNRDGILSASEHLDIATSLTAGQTAGTTTSPPKTLVVPANAQPGLTLMRVRSRGAFNQNGPGDACLSMGSGETEDYYANIIGFGPAQGMLYTWTPATTPLTGQSVTSAPFTNNPTQVIVVATDSIGCTFSDTISVAVNPAITSTVTTTDPTCFGYINGAITVNVGGGSPFAAGYNYLWNTNQTSNAISTIGAGTYVLTTTDSAGCTKVDSVTLVDPAPLSVSIVVTGASCGGSGAINAFPIPTGGTAPYCYTWLLDANTAWQTTSGPCGDTALNLPADTVLYLFTQDVNGCFTQNIFDTVYTTTPAFPIAFDSLVVNANIACNGGANGSITAYVSGGNPAYEYNLNGTGYVSGNTFTGLSAGTYTVTAKDNSGCTVTATVSVTEPSAVSATISSLNVSCNGGSNGSATASGSGGTAPYSYAWTGGPNTAVYGSLSAGTYTVTVTDNNLCSATSSVVINEPSALSLSSTVISNVSCNGGSNGSAAVTASGGVGQYSYTWNTVSGSDTNSSLSAGIYTIVVTDGNLCTASSTALITEPQALVLSVDSATSSLCSGAQSGQIAISTSGGTNPVTMTISPDPNNVGTVSSPYNWTGLGSGTYTIVATDANGCSNSTTVALQVSTGASVSITANLNPAYTLDDVVLSAIPNTFVSYAWSGPTNPSGTSDTIQLNDVFSSASGVYQVIATDGSGCTSSATINLVVNASVQMFSKVFLSGPYNSSTFLMSDALRTTGILASSATTEPYSSAPYNTAFVHVNGGGGETIQPGVLNVTGANAIVDWVFVQLRSAADSTQVVATKSALVQRDGDVVSTDGVSPMLFRFTSPGNYFVSIKHRNHLGIMPLATYALSEVPTNVDLTATSLSLYNRPAPFNNATLLDPYGRVFGAVRTLYAGNCNLAATGNPPAYRFIRYNGVSNDRATILAALGGVPTATLSGYHKEDLNMDGSVKYNGAANDRLVLLQAFGLNINNTIYEQTPN